MVTNHDQEAMIGSMFPRSIRHLQQLIMDAESCAKSIGQKSFFGKDKFKPTVDKFHQTLVTCVQAMAEDGHIKDPHNSSETLKQVDQAMQLLKQTYSSWPLAFEFWDAWYSSNQG